MANFQGDGKAIFQVFIGAIITLTLIAVIGTSIAGQITTAANSDNVTAPAVNGTLDLIGRTLKDSAKDALDFMIDNYRATQVGARTVHLDPHLIDLNNWRSRNHGWTG